MKLFTVFAFLSLSAVVRGWVAYLQPVLLSIGAAITTSLFQEIELPINIPPLKNPKWPVPEG